MMPVDFPGANTTFTKPAGWKDEDCADLKAMVGVDEGLPFIITAWKPSKEDIEAINRGEPIYMKTHGAGFTPTSMFTIDAEGNPNI